MESLFCTTCDNQSKRREAEVFCKRCDEAYCKDHNKVSFMAMGVTFAKTRDILRSNFGPVIFSQISFGFHLEIQFKLAGL